MTANELGFEASFWGDCTNTHVEEVKQYTYAQLMGIKRAHWSFIVNGASILDIGGGPVSMLLKCHDAGPSFVVDPLLNDVPEHVDADRSDAYPKWVTSRYDAKGITIIRSRGEDLSPDIAEPNHFDECWIYNVLQHVDDPALVIKNALSVCRRLRIFEWINVPPYEGHPHELTKNKLDLWLGQTPGFWGGGEVSALSHDMCFGDAYHAVVPGGAK